MEIRGSPQNTQHRASIPIAFSRAIAQRRALLHSDSPFESAVDACRGGAQHFGGFTLKRGFNAADHVPP